VSFGLRGARLDAVAPILGVGWPSSSVVLTSLYLLVVGTVVTGGLLRLRRTRSGGITRVLAAVATAVLVAAAIGGAIGESLFHTIALLAWGVFGIAPLTLAAIASVRRHHRPTRISAAAAAAGITAIGLHAFVVEPRWLEITHVEHVTPNVDREITIALVADLQTDAPGAYERRVLSEVAAAAPDLVLWAGDYLQIEDPTEYERATRALREIIVQAGLDPPLGMYAVQGNAETRPTWPELFDGTNVVAIPTTRRLEIAEGITLTALDLEDGFDPDLRIAPAEGLHLVLAHAPDYALGEVPADLLLAGHTHGGQVRLPGIGPILTLSQVPRAWAAGTTRLDDRRTLVVARGIGMERGPAPRLRFACRPELVFVHVRPS
jgi:uncharacterized protein